MSISESAVQETIAAYRAAAYALRLPGGHRIDLSVDAAIQPSLDALLQARAGENRLANALITAWNPFSQPTSRSENHLRQRDLLRCLGGSARAVLVGVGYGDGWREPSFAALGIELVTLDRLAREFRQNATLTFRCNESVRLRLHRDDWRAVLADADVDFAPAL
jgi:hypothetical protein